VKAALVSRKVLLSDNAGLRSTTTKRAPMIGAKENAMIVPMNILDLYIFSSSQYRKEMNVLIFNIHIDEVILRSTLPGLPHI